MIETVYIVTLGIIFFNKRKIYIFLIINQILIRTDNNVFHSEFQAEINLKNFCLSLNYQDIYH